MPCTLCRSQKRQASNLLPIMEPQYNLREIVKQLVLLEDHLNHARKRCPDCITKHFLTIEALAEECVSLDTQGTYVDTADAVASCIRMTQRWWIDKVPERDIAQYLRRCRKMCQKHIMSYKVASSMRLANKSMRKPLSGKFIEGVDAITRIAEDFRSGRELFVETYNENLSRPLPRDKVVQIVWDQAWEYLRTTGASWVEYILENLDIPSGKEKSLEMAVRLFTQRKPRSVQDWYWKNQHRLLLLVEAAQWPYRTDDSDRVVKIGSFRVHNTLGASESMLEEMRQVFAKAEAAIKRIPLPKIKNTLYGDVFLVGQIERKSWVAWYLPSKDVIYYRANMKSSFEEKVKTLVHELGHRYWGRSASKKLKQKWLEYDQSVRSSSSTGRIPEVGEILPFKMVGHKRVHIIKDTEAQSRGYVHVVNADSGDDVGYVKTITMMKWMAEAEDKKKFPTLYAMTDPEEHFCEMLGLYATGQLKAPFKDQFKLIIS